MKVGKILNNKLTTERLHVRMLYDLEMQNLIDNETNIGLKHAYSQMLRASLSNPVERQWFATWIIELNDEAQSRVGDLCFKGLKSDGKVEISYGLIDTYWNKGYATEAVSSIVKWALKQPKVKAVEAESESDNIVSIRVIKKNNFVLTGEIGDKGPRFVCQ